MLKRSSQHTKNSAVQFSSLLATSLPVSRHETLYLCLVDRINICICSRRDPTALCGRPSSSLRNSSVFGEDKTNKAFRNIDNAGVAGWGCRTFLSIPANILGDSALNIITREITVSHEQKGVGDWLKYSKIHSVTVGVRLNAFPRIPRLRFAVERISTDVSPRRDSAKQNKLNLCCRDINLWTFQGQTIKEGAADGRAQQ